MQRRRAGSKRRGGHDGIALEEGTTASAKDSSTSIATNDDHDPDQPGRGTYPASSSLPASMKNSYLRSSSSSSRSWGTHLLVVAQLLLLLLQSPRFVTAQQCENALEIYVYDSESQCTSRETPSAVGQLYADSTCRATQVLSQQSSEATFLLPGRYSASCVPPGSSESTSDTALGQVKFIESGCTSSSCSSSSGGDVCDRDGGATSTFYSRLTPPIYNVQSSADSNFVCLQLRSGDTSFWFAVFGDCTETSCSGGVATDSPTEAPDTTTEAPTDAPPEPTPSPITSRPSAAPVAEPSPTPQPAVGDTPEPTKAATDSPEPAPTPVTATTSSPVQEPSPTSGSPQDAPTPSPILKPPSQSQTPAATQESAGMNVGVLVGAVLGAMIALSVVLVAGFYAGSLRQKNKQNSTGNVSPNNNGDGGSGSGKGDPGDGNQATWIPATMATGFATSKEIVVDSNYGDDVSTLGTPWGVMSTGPGGATVVIEDGTVAQNSVAWDYKNKPEPSLAEDSNTFASGPTAILSGALAGYRGNGTNKGRTILADDSSFEKAYDDDEKDYDEDDTDIDNGTPGGMNTASQGLRFTVTVPSGKLGMVIDNSPGTVPEVRALKPDSVLVSRGVLVGDYLEQVDGLDVRDWTCLQVSQMIQKKSGQKSRELVFFRRPRNSSSGAVFTIDEL